MNKNNKNFQYSKIITLLTIILFCGCIARCFMLDISNTYDLTMYGIILTTSGTLCATAVVWYLKNSQAEKVARIKADTYRVISEERYKFNEKMLELKSRYNYIEEDFDEVIDEIEEDNPMDELEQEAMDSMNSSVDNAMEEAISSIEIQTID